MGGQIQGGGRTGGGLSQQSLVEIPPTIGENSIVRAARIRPGWLSFSVETTEICCGIFVFSLCWNDSLKCTSHKRHYNNKKERTFQPLHITELPITGTLHCANNQHSH